MLLSNYIKENFADNKAAFARHVGVEPQAVTKWIKANWIIIDNILYSPRREVPDA